MHRSVQIAALAEEGELSAIERELIYARMTERRKRARANGVKFGP